MILLEFNFGSMGFPMIDPENYYILLFSVMTPSVAFSVRLAEATTLGDSPVVYETVDLNIGDSYDEFTGNYYT